MAEEFIYLSLAELLDGFKKKQFSVKEVVTSMVARCEKFKNLNAYITDCFSSALEQAELSDKRYANGENSRLEGAPLGIKDLFCTKDILTTSGSHILYNFVPPYESTVTSKLLDQRAIFLGKTNMDEFAMGSSNETSYFGNVINPWKSQNSDKDLVPGGSSGGSAAAVAAHLCYGALGSDTGGSVRQPASFCGIVGLKPTYGRCSRYGMIAFASSLDQAGTMTKTVEDSAILLEAIAGYDQKDATSSEEKVPNYASFIGKSLKGLKVGIPVEYHEKVSSKEIEGLWSGGIEVLKEAGVEIKEISLPHTKYALPAYYIIAPAEASSNLARFDGIRFGYRGYGNTLQEIYENSRDVFGKEVRRRIMIGTYVLSSGHFDDHYFKAKKVQRLILNDFLNAYKDVDVILTPTAPSGAFGIGEEVADPVQMYLNDVFTVTVNLAGIPAISVPFGYTEDGLPLGLQLMANHFREDLLFQVGSKLESESGFKYWREQ